MTDEPTEPPAENRKPAGMSFTSWIDQQIEEAAARGAFDDLPGAGKPLPDRGDSDAAQAWLREYLRREGVPPDELLPTPLRLRKEAERLAETAQDLRSEQQVRDVVNELNQRIMDWRRLPLGSPVFVPLVDEELMVGRWRRGQASHPPATMPAGQSQASAGAPAARPRWWRRIMAHGKNRQLRSAAEKRPPFSSGL